MTNSVNMAKESLKRIGIGVTALGLAYGALFSASLIAYGTSPKIRSQAKLESMLEQEKRRQLL